MTLNIVTFPNEILLQKCSPIENVSEYYSTLTDMVAFVNNSENGAVGLALPQVGITKRGFVTQIAGKTQVCINPVILKKNGGKFISTEGCLSIPDYSTKVDRYKSVTVRFKDLNGKIHIKELKGFDSKIFQHELDHLNGVMINQKSLVTAVTA